MTGRAPCRPVASDCIRKDSQQPGPVLDGHPYATAFEAIGMLVRVILADEQGVLPPSRRIVPFQSPDVVAVPALSFLIHRPFT
jgi:hypothetical protein